MNKFINCPEIRKKNRPVNNSQAYLGAIRRNLSKTRIGNFANLML